MPWLPYQRLGFGVSHWPIRHTEADGKFNSMAESGFCGHEFVGSIPVEQGHFGLISALFCPLFPSFPLKILGFYHFLQSNKQEIEVSAIFSWLSYQTTRFLPFSLAKSIGFLRLAFPMAQPWWNAVLFPFKIYGIYDLILWWFFSIVCTIGCGNVLSQGQIVRLLHSR